MRNHPISTDIAAATFLWVLPTSLYLTLPHEGHKTHLLRLRELELQNQVEKFYRVVQSQ